MRVFILSLVLVLVGCASGNNQPNTPDQPVNGNVIACVHKYDSTLKFQFKESDVVVYQNEMFGQVVKIYEITAIDGQQHHLNESQWVNFNCVYPN